MTDNFPIATLPYRIEAQTWQ